MARSAQILAFGGGGFSMESGNRLLDEHALTLTGRARPRVCFLPTASGDADHYIVRFYRTFGGGRTDASHISLFRRDGGVGDLHRHLLEQDLIYVGGGSVISLLGVWRAHGLDTTLRRAWEQGVVLCGLSAGSLCWFEQGVTAYHGTAEPVSGLGFLPWSNAVHYDDEPGRRDCYRREVAAGMRAGYAAADGAALHFVGEDLAGVVASRPGACGYHVRREGSDVSETPLPTDYLGGPVAVPEPVAAAEPAPPPAADGAGAAVAAV